MTRVLAIAIAVAANAVALAAVQGSMGQIVERERLALREPTRIVVIDQRSEPPLVTVQNCPAPAHDLL